MIFQFLKVEITNRSTGAETYEWSFEGASVTGSTEKVRSLLLMPPRVFIKSS